MALAAFALLAGCVAPAGDGPDPRRARNVVLISIDTLRADHVGAYGAANASTPTIDAVARDGVRFEKAIAVTPLTLPSHATMLTGLYPPRHSIRYNGTYRLPDGIPTLAQRLSSAGYATAAFVGATVLGAAHGLNRGFDLYDDRIDARKSHEHGFVERPASEVTRAAVEWLGEAQQPFFLFVHYYDPHLDYDPPEAFAERFRDRPYDGEIAYVDSNLDALLDALRASGAAEKTAVLITSDHGEGLGEHNEKGHSFTLYDSTLWVPLIMSGPEIPQGTVVEGVVSIASITPTILSYLDLAPIRNSDGQDLTALWRGPVASSATVYAETLATQIDHGWSPLHAARDDRYHYVRAPRPELYDVEADPGQTHNLIGRDDPRWERARNRLDEHVSNVLATESTGERVVLSAKQRAQMQRLGYMLSGDRPAPPSGIDPKDGLPWFERFLAAAAAVDRGETEKPRAFLTKMLEALPDSLRAHALMARVLLADGEPEEALPHIERALLGAPESYHYHGILSSVHRALGNEAEADAASARAAHLHTEQTVAKWQIVRRLVLRGNREEAARVADLLIEEEPDNELARFELSRMWNAIGWRDRAARVIEDGLARSPQSKRLHLAMALLMARAGSVDKAEEHLAQAGSLLTNAPVADLMARAWEEGGSFARAEALRERTLASHAGFAHGGTNLEETRQRPR